MKILLIFIIFQIDFCLILENDPSLTKKHRKLFFGTSDEKLRDMQRKRFREDYDFKVH